MLEVLIWVGFNSARSQQIYSKLLSSHKLVSASLPSRGSRKWSSTETDGKHLSSHELENALRIQTDRPEQLLSMLNSPINSEFRIDKENIQKWFSDSLQHIQVDERSQTKRRNASFRLLLNLFKLILCIRAFVFSIFDHQTANCQFTCRLVTLSNETESELDINNN